MDDGVIRTGAGIIVVGRGLGDDLAPWRDNQRMAIGAAAVRMGAALRGGDDETGCFNARARSSTCQCALPLLKVKAAGMASISAPSRARRR